MAATFFTSVGAKLRYLLSAHWVLITISTIIFFGIFRKDTFFCDYSIIWDGAYRINIGQKIYTDFFLPTGPVSLILPSIFFKIVGYSYDALKYAQMMMSIIIAVSYGLIINKLKQDDAVRLIHYYSFLLLFVLPLAYPWYNTTALMLVLVGLSAILYIQKLAGLLLGGVFLGTALLAKQDYGLFGIFFVSACILFNVFEDAESKYNNFFKIALIFIVSILVVVVFSIYDPAFLDHISLGQNKDGYDRILRIFTRSTNYLYFLILVALLGYYYFKPHKFTLFGIFLMGYATLVKSTSGLPHLTATFYSGVLIVFVFIVIKEQLINKKLILFPLIAVSIFLLVKPAKNFGTLFISTMTNHVLMFNHNFDKREMSIYSDLPSTQSMYLNKDSYRVYRDLKEYISKNFTNPRSVKMLNISELTFLNYELGLPPLKGLPLWFHDGITFSKKDYLYLQDYLQQTNFDIIVTDESQTFMLNYIENSRKYCNLHGITYKSPIERPITIYVQCN